MDEDELKNMSPEQIAQMQKQNCIFCKIIAGEIPSKKIYEDNQFIGILDINPATDGHVLLLPKQHVQIMPQMNGDQIGGLGFACQNISDKMIKAFRCDGTSIFMANGVVAGQRAPHFMVHIIPRKDGDGIDLNPKFSEINDAQFSSTKQKILSSLGVKTAGGAAGANMNHSAQRPSAPKAAVKLADEKKKKKELDAEFEEVVHIKGEGKPTWLDSVDRQQSEEIRQMEDKAKGAAGNDEEWEEEERKKKAALRRKQLKDNQDEEVKEEEDEAPDEEQDEGSKDLDGEDEDSSEEEEDEAEQKSGSDSGKIDFDKLARLFK
jgi:histidine triad (HIT) family protein